MHIFIDYLYRLYKAPHIWKFVYCSDRGPIESVYIFGIRIIIQENDDNITIELLAENICKNIDVDDEGKITGLF